jgi:GNAT superfamily N-acetyltransferase
VVGERVARAADAVAVTELFALAFHDDPTWSWAFPDPDRRHEQQRSYWGLMVNSALPLNWVWMTDGGEAASLWIPPGQPELSEEDERRFEPLLRELTGDRADEVMSLTDAFDANHPREQPHYYLSLLGTHPDHRGGGHGMALLAENLGRIDAEGAAAYLESSNPANDHRYERYGFEKVGAFSAPGGEPVVSCMWREPR